MIPALHFGSQRIHFAAIDQNLFESFAMEDKKSDKALSQEEFAKAEELFRRGNYRDASALFSALAARTELPGKLPKKAADFLTRMKPDAVYTYVAAGTAVFLFLLYISFH
jgi:hypothetical protein